MSCNNIDDALEQARGGLAGDDAPYLEAAPYGCPAGCEGVEYFGGEALAVATGDTADCVVQPQKRVQVERPWFDQDVADNFVLTRFQVGSDNMLLADGDMPLSAWTEFARSKALRRVVCNPNSRVLMTVKNIAEDGLDHDFGVMYSAYRLPEAGDPCNIAVKPVARRPYGCPAGCFGMHYFGANSDAAIAKVGAGDTANVTVEPQKACQIERPWLTRTMASNFRLLSFKIGSDNILIADSASPMSAWTDFAKSLAIRAVKAAANTKVVMRVQNLDTVNAHFFRVAYSAYLLERP